MAGRPCTRGSTVAGQLGNLSGRKFVTYLACADLVESNEGESLRQHRARQIFSCKHIWDHQNGEEQLWNESERLNPEAGSTAIRAVEM